MRETDCGERVCVRLLHPRDGGWLCRQRLCVLSFLRARVRPVGVCVCVCSAREASQIFGGLSYTRGGQGEKVERLYREVRAFAIPGGSEEIMLDLGIRQGIRPYAMRLMQQEKEKL